MIAVALMGEGQPTVSVVVMSDYGSWDAEGWNGLRATLTELGRQSEDIPAEVLLVDSLPDGKRSPADLKDALPSLKVIGPAPVSAQELLNRAACEARGEFVALLDGDCRPAPGWLRAAAETLRTHPEAAVASGRTFYPDRDFSCRVLGLLSRGFIDPGKAGPTRFISNYNAVFRREVLRAHPLPEFRRALAARLQAESIRNAGGRFYFEPRMQVTHRFDGWPMERRIRRNVGYRTIRIRQLDPRVSHAWMVRAGFLSIPLVLSARTLDSFWDCVRVGRYYGLRWFELPAAFAIAIVVHLFEIRGMAAALTEARGDVSAAGASARPAQTPSSPSHPLPDSRS